jgi:hypothetical protein
VNANGGKHSFILPKSLRSGDYLIRGEIIALHVASSYPGVSKPTRPGPGRSEIKRNDVLAFLSTGTILYWRKLGSCDIGVCVADGCRVM